MARLRAVVRRRVPVVAVALLAGSGGEAPSRTEVSRADVLRVTYRQCGPWDVVWDVRAEVYVWASGPLAGEWFGPDLDEAAGHIATAVGAPVGAGPGSASGSESGPESA
ncbi:hypothetical protein [Actinomadura keratinilytica]|uniref:Uncharacterized protein n=1 Tax=Actinomadura keratinilytica TaxID=547461 RepID=A0ABP6UJR4_9ACTN